MHSSPTSYRALPPHAGDVVLDIEDEPASGPAIAVDPWPAHATAASPARSTAQDGQTARRADPCRRSSLGDTAHLQRDATFADTLRWVQAAAERCQPGEVQTLEQQMRQLRSDCSRSVCLDLHTAFGDDPIESPTLSRAVDAYFETGQPRHLPPELQRAMHEATAGEPPAQGVSGRLMALLAGLRQLGDRMDAHGATRTALNFAHTTARSLGSVGLTTFARQAVGRAIDLALAQGTSELTRTAIGAGAMGLPVLGQLMLLWRDEQHKDATPYSRATRGVLMGLSIGVGGLALATGTLTSPGLRLAEVVLYPLLRDAAQALFPMTSDPDSGPTRRSLVAAGGAYAVNQLGVSRAFAAAPDASASSLLWPGLVVRSLANAAGESVDLMSLLYANHITRHGASTLPRLRIGQGSLSEAVQTPLHWDTMAARGCFVSAFNQLYDTLLADHTLTRALRPVVGEAHAFAAADWLTELSAAALTVLTYPFWTDPVHARGFTPPTLDPLAAMEEGQATGRRHPGTDGACGPVQYAGNDAEPAVAADDDGPVQLVRVLNERDRPTTPGLRLGARQRAPSIVSADSSSGGGTSGPASPTTTVTSV
ncbi:hypothetical protein [Roseateles terrae]|uniref:Type III effector protein n=1 Tax=Roseateles terrae TaxID=431060 RepID=A0ABR6GQN4_9BURK|nr:hypothetical protein [Roseateles terrae]MBB3194379.1 hypothetical protein [Roseateles terrae]OWQ88211.1 hypothetical protein CDN98_08785 [Roseateles terrae]